MKKVFPALFSIFLAFGFVKIANAKDFQIRLEVTQECLADTLPKNHFDCVGKASEACMSENQYDDSTIGMSSCANLELEWWDKKLNAAYSELLKYEKADDEEIKSYQSAAHLKAPALKEMQRKWIAYRDSLCEYEVSQWGGGTGGGPAFMSCMMTETGRQYFVLRNQIGASN